jgi:hypothetical protein
MLKGILVDDQLTKTCSHSIVDRYLSNNQCMKHQPDILPRERSDKSLNALKVSAEVSSIVVTCPWQPIIFCKCNISERYFVLTETFSTCQVLVDLFR